MTVAAMREALINRYSHTIRGRSVDRMPDGQVIAIYHSLLERCRHITLTYLYPLHFGRIQIIKHGTLQTAE